MFAPPVVKAKAAANPTSELALQRATLVARPFVGSAAEQAHMAPRGIGNRATLRLLSQRDRNLTENEPQGYDAQEVDPASLTARGATPGVSGDFSEIPVFPPDRAAQTCSRPPLAAPPLPRSLQPKIAVGHVNDPLEHEADRIADQVMRMPEFDHAVAAAPARLSRKCAACGDEEARTLRAKPGEALKAAGDAAPDIVHEVLEEPGKSLEASTREFFEPRLGRDLGSVRVHADARAAESARAVNALAYTVGRDLVFGHGQYAPDAAGGRRLLAHELAHVVQQGGATPRVQRACGPAALGPPTPDCAPSDLGVGGWQFLFKVNCDELLPGEEAKVSKLKKGSALDIHGSASLEGPAGFNVDLSCHRANKIADLVRAARPDCSITGTFKHGASPVSGPGVVPDANPPAFWRSVIIQETQPAPGPPQPKSTCGPDATDWLVQQMVMAKKNAKVQAVRSKIDVANFFAPQISPKASLNAMDMLEGQELNMIAKAWDAAGKPQHTPDANQQLGEPSAVLGTLELQAAMGAVNTEAVTTLLALRDAATGWKNLVGAGRPYDFKVDASTMADPKSANCPDADCSKTITLCPGSPGINCFEKDLPGNVLYAHVGAFVGFSENALQLGSQWAQLQPSGGQHWDPPADTQMIDFGFNLPTPLTRAGFCAALQGAKASFATHPCKDCNETPAGIGFVNP